MFCCGIAVCFVAVFFLSRVLHSRQSKLLFSALYLRLNGSCGEHYTLSSVRLSVSLSVCVCVCVCLSLTRLKLKVSGEYSAAVAF